jgi:hypothetical protein
MERERERERERQRDGERVSNTAIVKSTFFLFFYPLSSLRFLPLSPHLLCGRQESDVSPTASLLSSLAAKHNVVALSLLLLSLPLSLSLRVPLLHCSFSISC